MSKRRSVEIFSAGCPVCETTISQVQELACSSCAVEVVDMNAPGVAARAARLGIESLPAVAVDGVLAGCCAGGGIDLETLRAMGVGVPG